MQNAAKTELAGLQAALKREKTKNSSLQQSLDQKVSVPNHSQDLDINEISHTFISNLNEILIHLGGSQS